MLEGARTMKIEEAEACGKAWDIVGLFEQREWFATFWDNLTEEEQESVIHEMISIIQWDDD